VIWRQRLVRRFAAAVEDPLTVVTAPAGYGKTVAIQQFLESTSLPAVRVAARPTDSPRGYRRRIAHALRDAGVELHNVGRARSRLRSGDEHSVLRALIEDVRSLAEPTVVVLDDFHLVGDPRLQRQLEFVVNRLPRSLRLVVVSRQRLRLPLARWRAQGRMVEIGLDDLRFAPEEAAALLERLGRPGVSEADADELNQRAEGWAVGLHLLAACHPKDLHDSDVDHEAVRGLAEHLLACQPPDVQDFVLATAGLGRLCADLCREVTRREDAGRYLQVLEDANLFLTPLDQTRVWFRYHGLFAELMCWRLDDRQPGAAVELHQRAAAWFDRNGEVGEAVGHLVAAGRTGEALALANENAYRPWRAESFLGTDWDSVFPAEWVSDDPGRMLNYAVLLGRTGWLDRARAWIDRAAAALAEQPDDDPRHGLLRAVEALWHNVHLDAERTLAAAEEALARVPAVAENDLVRARLQAAIVNARLLVDDVGGAESALAALSQIRSPELALDLIVPGLQARLALRRGELRRAATLGHRVLRTAERVRARRHPAVQDANRALAGVLAEQGQLDQAEAYASQAVEGALAQRWPGQAAATELDRARVRAARCGPDAGLAVLGAARRAMRDPPVGRELVAAFDGFEARLRLQLGDLDRAERLTAALPAGVESSLLGTRLALARHDVSGAAERLGSVSSELLRDRIVVHLLAARIAAAQGKADERDRHLLAAAFLGEREGFGHVYVDEAPDLLQRLRDLVGYPQRRISTTNGAAPSGSGPGQAFDPEPLTDKERRVLRYLAGSLTYPEMAGHLEVSTNTVKSHVRSLYRKLGVHSRAEAVVAGRHAGLLSRPSGEART
jgi:LuxR family maltose regulon positive regulatory protein